MNKTLILLAIMVSTNLSYTHTQETFILKGEVFRYDSNSIYFINNSRT